MWKCEKYSVSQEGEKVLKSLVYCTFDLCTDFKRIVCCCCSYFCILVWSCSFSSLYCLRFQNKKFQKSSVSFWISIDPKLNWKFTQNWSILFFVSKQLQISSFWFSYVKKILKINQSSWVCVCVSFPVCFSVCTVCLCLCVCARTICLWSFKYSIKINNIKLLFFSLLLHRINAFLAIS